MTYKSKYGTLFSPVVFTVSNYTQNYLQNELFSFGNYYERCSS